MIFERTHKKGKREWPGLLALGATMGKSARWMACAINQTRGYQRERVYVVTDELIERTMAEHGYTIRIEPRPDMLVGEWIAQNTDGCAILECREEWLGYSGRKLYSRRYPDGIDYRYMLKSRIRILGLRTVAPTTT